MRISDWSSDVCSSDLQALQVALGRHQRAGRPGDRLDDAAGDGIGAVQIDEALQVFRQLGAGLRLADHELVIGKLGVAQVQAARQAEPEGLLVAHHAGHAERSEEHTSELQSLMRISYAVFCLKKKNT